MFFTILTIIYHVSKIDDFFTPRAICRIALLKGVAGRVCVVPCVEFGRENPYQGDAAEDPQTDNRPNGGMLVQMEDEPNGTDQRDLLHVIRETNGLPYFGKKKYLQVVARQRHVLS
jgi:hypothetical protein